ncbi:MAG: YbaB/EbfC family nucleoid-associated protein [Candidatus Eisenbacteria bacterium]|uniref:Nucleoid-associated protein E6K74_05625 n=1 Tax=Eiseniibacteriota bacterium TaxID=2212470 RepID=A0A538TFJ8_UNCEI|nr:MAG: YbaB/EbfC family nucleoid-associated protein [Candidatus Eisenbacteria bacterium]TMQ62374.1 MAG: YbaB/EbfC family nucleoid-associated protein [Candidatus Eisenbacteria bacterium]
MKNIQAMMQKAQALQTKMTELQAELKTREMIGSSGQGKVKVTMNGAQDVIAISIDPEVVNPEEADLLEDLVLAAFNDARSKITRMVEEEMKKVSGGLGLPPGLF